MPDKLEKPILARTNDTRGAALRAKRGYWDTNPMTTPAVVFGGPSDEHDISILTGLQVCHALTDVYAFYWSKGGEWYQVEPNSEAADYIEGPPRRSRQVAVIPQVGQ